MKSIHQRFSRKFYGKTLVLSLGSLIIISIILFAIFASVFYKNNLKYTQSSIEAENIQGNEQAAEIINNSMQICMLFATYKNISPVYQAQTDIDLKKATIMKEAVTFVSCFEYISGIDVVTNEFRGATGSYNLQEPVVTAKYKNFDISYQKNEKWPNLLQIKYSSDNDVYNSVKIGLNSLNLGRLCCKDSSYCVASDGTIVLSGDASALGKNIKKITGSSLDDLLKGKSKYIVSSSQLLSEELHFLTIVKTSESQIAFGRQILLLSLSFLIITAVGCLIIYTLLRKIYSPIEKIVEVFKYYLPENKKLAESEIKFISECLYDKDMDEPTKKAALQIRESQLYVLHSQISPHFLGNALDVLKFESIKELGLGNSIERALGILSMFLKETQQYQRMFSTVAEEIARTKEYIKIATFCFNENLSVIWEVEETLLNCIMISLTLQPLIENSIMHGFDPDCINAVIIIKISAENDAIRIDVSDNGHGMPEELLESIKATLNDDSITDSHIGLKNTHLKMKLLYGSEYGIKSITSSEKGTAIELLFPKKFFNSN